MKLINVLSNAAPADSIKFSFRDDDAMCIYTETNGLTDFLCVVPAEVVADLDKRYGRGTFEWSLALDLMDAYIDDKDIWRVLADSEIECQSYESELDDWI